MIKKFIAKLLGKTAKLTFRFIIWGLFGNLFLPSIVGGDVVRAGVAMRHARSTSALLLGSLVDRVQDVIGLGVLAGLGALLAPRTLDDASQRIFMALGVVLVGGVVAGLLALRFFPARLVPFKARRLLVKVREAVMATAARPGAQGPARIGPNIHGVAFRYGWS